MQHVDVTLLGGFEVRVDGDPVPASAWTHGRARDLVKLLALARGHRLPRDRVLDELWPQLGVDPAMANLHKAAHHARRALGDPDGLVLRGGLVMLAPEALVETDVERFEASADPTLYRGELLPDDAYASWAEEPRRRLRARYLDSLRAAGRWEEVAAADPTDETAQLAVMRARFAAGDRPGALRAFERAGSRACGRSVFARVSRPSRSTPASQAAPHSRRRSRPSSSSSGRPRLPNAPTCSRPAPTC